MEFLTDIFTTLQDQIFAPERLPVAIAALMAVVLGGVLTGPVAGNANPLFWRSVDKLFGNLGAKLDKGGRAPADLAGRGLAVVFIACILALMLGAAFQKISLDYSKWLIADIVALSIIMSAGTVWFALLRLRKALKETGSVKGAFYAIAVSSRTNLAGNDDYTITRVGISLGARSFDKAVVAPILWFLIGGLPAAYIYSALAALSWRFGRDGTDSGFGRPMAVLEKLLGFVPNLLAGLLIALAGLITPTAGMTRAVFSILIPFRKGAATYGEGGAAVTSMAYALNVSLGGPTQDLDGRTVKRGWTGPSKATARLEAGHLNRALYVLVMAHILLLAVLLAAIVLDGHGIFTLSA